MLLSQFYDVTCQVKSDGVLVEERNADQFVAQCGEDHESLFKYLTSDGATK